MAQFPEGDGALPGAYSDVNTQSRGVSVPGGLRLGALMGEGKRTERLVVSALGRGKDGLDANFASSGAPNGRHFKLTYVPIVSNRLTLFRNGIPLTGLESDNFILGSATFSSLYDYRYDTQTGYIEMQGAVLQDQGGSFYKAGSANVGNGTVGGLTLLDLNALQETWTVRCSSVIRDTNGDPIDGYATFVANGSLSGNILDANGNLITWKSGGITNDNGVLSFSITDGSTKFREGDSFTIKVKSGVLSPGDSLTATYISEADLNDPVFFTDPKDLMIKHGLPSLENRLSLGAFLTFANTPPGVWACQTAPSVPRRVSYLVEDKASGNALIDDLKFALPLGVTPDADSNVHFFITDPVTKIEKQILPNKVAFYDSNFTATPANFCFNASYDFSYTVVLNDAVVKTAENGVLTNINGSTATFSSQSVSFGQDDLSGTRTLHIATPAGNAGTYTIVSVANGVLTISRNTGSFTNATGLHFRILDSSETSAEVIITDDLALQTNAKLRLTVVDQKDAPFFDVSWLTAFEAMETIETDMLAPLPSQTISAIFAEARQHCQTMSNIQNRKERVLIIGAIKGLTPDNVIGTKAAAVEDLGVLEGIQGDSISEILAGNIEDLTDYGVPNSFGNTFRVIYLYPDEVIVQIGADRLSVDGFFMAPALMGYLSATANINIPATNKVITGFAIPRTKLFRPAILKSLAAAGICVLQPAVGGGKIIWGKTTTQSGFIEEEEISVVFIRDRIAKDIRRAFDGFAGTPEDITTRGTLLSRANSVLQGFVSRKLITAFKDVSVKQNATDGREWDVSALVKPTLPINWIFISIGVSGSF